MAALTSLSLGHNRRTCATRTYMYPSVWANEWETKRVLCSVHRNPGLAKPVKHAECVLNDVLDWRVASHTRCSDELQIRMQHGQHECDRVVGACVNVQDYLRGRHEEVIQGVLSDADSRLWDEAAFCGAPSRGSPPPALASLRAAAS